MCRYVADVDAPKPENRTGCWQGCRRCLFRKVLCVLGVDVHFLRDATGYVSFYYLFFSFFVGVVFGHEKPAL